MQVKATLLCPSDRQTYKAAPATNTLECSPHITACPFPPPLMSSSTQHILPPANPCEGKNPKAGGDCFRLWALGTWLAFEELHLGH